MREGASGNIGSIITMLIDEQNTVDIDDILTEEQCRQHQVSNGKVDSQHHSVSTQQPKIKEEVEVQISDYQEFQEFSRSSQEFSFSETQYRPSASSSWSQPAQILPQAEVVRRANTTLNDVEAIFYFVYLSEGDC